MDGHFGAMKWPPLLSLAIIALLSGLCNVQKMEGLTAAMMKCVWGRGRFVHQSVRSCLLVCVYVCALVCVSVCV